MPKLTLPLTARQQVAQGTMSFTFDRGGQAFSFKAGQHLNATLLRPLYQDAEGSTRTFSIASSPGDPFLMIATRMRGSAFKRSLAEMSLGSPVNVSGPFGSFVLPQDAATPLVLVAGGIGITPFRSIVKDATERQLPHRLTLLYANRTPEEAPFLEELYRWEKQNPNLRFFPTMTKPEVSQQGWSGRVGYVDVPFVREILAGFDRFTAYVAGPPGMVEGVTAVLMEAGVPQDKIRTEKFSGY